MKETETLQYNSLADIQIRKAQLQTELLKKELEIKDSWKRVIIKEKTNRKGLDRYTHIFSSSVGVVDGLLLGWKLYRKFGKPGKTRWFKKKK